MPNAWLLRPIPNDRPSMKEFLSEKIVAIGWWETRDLTGMTRSQIKERLSQPPFNYTSLKLGQNYGAVDIFVNQMQVGDLVVVPDDVDIHFCQIKSDYRYDPKLANDKDGYPHQRQVVWLKTVSRKDLPMDLRSSLKAQQTATNLTKHYATIEALAFGKSLPMQSTSTSPSNLVSVDYPLRPDVMIKVAVPRDITTAEAERLGNFIKTLHWD